MIPVLLFTMVITLIAMLAYRWWAPRVGLVDNPNYRSAHKRPTVVGAGVAIVLGVSAGWVALDGAGVQFPMPLEWLLPSIAFLAIVGLVDDKLNVPSWLRMLFYTAVSAFLLSQVASEVIAPLSLVLLTVAFVWQINLFNFMDGLDGFAGLQALCVCVGMALASWWFGLDGRSVAMASAVLGAAIFVFLWFNWPAASVFMGDAGSVPLGFLLAVLGLWAGLVDVRLAGVWLILMMPFLVDATGTLLIRIMQGHAPHIAHSDHCYQRLARSTGSALTIDLGLLALHGLWQFPLATVFLSHKDYSLFFLVILSALPALGLLVRARFSA